MKEIKRINILEMFFGKKRDIKEYQKLEKEILNKNLKIKKNVYSFLPYKNKLVQELIIDLKFKKKHQNAKILANLIEEYFLELIEEWYFYQNFKDIVLINVPIHFLRRFFRGYNQNDLVIQEIFKNNPELENMIKWERNILKKTKYTKPQSKTKNKKERLKNVKNSFKIKNKEKIKGKNIIIFDDIYTTGATTDEIIKELKKAKVKEIKILTLAY